MLGTCIGRSLYWLEHDGIYDREICGFPYVNLDSSLHYRALVVTSEPIAHEDWQEVPDNRIFELTTELSLRMAPTEAGCQVPAHFSAKA